MIVRKQNVKFFEKGVFSVMEVPLFPYFQLKPLTTNVTIGWGQSALVS